eukprot:14186091-Heterocapsa_arctica.AAC.1
MKRLGGLRTVLGSRVCSAPVRSPVPRLATIRVLSPVTQAAGATTLARNGPSVVFYATRILVSSGRT